MTFVVIFSRIGQFDLDVSHEKICLQILDTNPQLFFHLQQQRMIELIRKGKIEEALEFAQAELAPRGEENGLTSGFYSMKLYIFGDTHKSGNVENFCSKAF
uniref:Glucose-induced degradation protein 8 homolog isoform X2 n=1 Tax=Rhizophora mucronata TaxID=61149 RepID=A0A2P2LFR7_RHIMU